jgi:N-acetylneuraminic acid mutarotase
MSSAFPLLANDDDDTSVDFNLNTSISQAIDLNTSISQVIEPTETMPTVSAISENSRYQSIPVIRYRKTMMIHRMRSRNSTSVCVWSILSRLLVLHLLLMPLGKQIVVSSQKLRPWHQAPHNPFAHGKPSARGGHVMVGCPDGALYLFGGKSCENLRSGFSYDCGNDAGTQPSNELFKLDLTLGQWSAITSSGPSPSARWDHSMVASGADIFLFGGFTGFSGGSESNEFWQFSISTMKWNQLGGQPDGESRLPTELQPAGRSGHAMASMKGDIFIHGGTLGGRPYSDEFWQYSNSTKTWKRLDSDSGVLGTPPRGRAYHDMVAMGSKILLYGGYDYNHYFEFLAGLWQFTASPTMQWTRLTSPSLNPGARAGIAMVAVENRIFLHGGYDNYFGFEKQDMWSLSFDDASSGFGFSCTQVTSPGARARGSRSMSVVGSDIVVHGVKSKSDPAPADEIWRVSTAAVESAASWAQLDKTTSYGVSHTPIGRQQQAMVAVDSEIFLFGGRLSPRVNEENEYFDSNGLWKMSSLSWDWTALDATVQGTSPSARFGHAMASVENKIFVFGGDTSLTGNELSNEMFEFSTQTSQWTIIDTVMGSPPSPRMYSAMAAVGSVIFVHGGQTASGSSVNEMLRFSTQTPQEWETIDGDSVGGPAPSARRLHTMVSVDGQLLLYGGNIGGGDECSNELWQFLPSSQRWNLLHSNSDVHGIPLKGLAGHAAAVVHGDMFIWGGMDSSSVISDELRRFSRIKEEWTIIGGKSGSDAIPGAPDAAEFVSMTAIGEKLYIFGGKSSCCWGDTMYVRNTGLTLEFPRNISAFTAVFDDDMILVTDNEWDWQLDVCSQAFLPCSLAFSGGNASEALMRRRSASSIRCSADSGCTNVSFSRVRVVCDPGLPGNQLQSVLGPLQLMGEGAEMNIRNVSFTDCVSIEDGGSIRAYSGAKLDISGSDFQRSYSLGNGGAVAIVGADATMSATSFENCSATLDGGAVWVSHSVRNYPLTPRTSIIHLSSCEINHNKAGTGGGVVILGNSAADMHDTNFRGNTAAVGAGVAILDKSSVTIRGARFIANTAVMSGGAVALKDQSGATILDSSFTDNQAHSGGAASMDSQSSAIVKTSHFEKNTASGQGGALTVAGRSSIAISDCNLTRNEAVQTGGAVAGAGSTAIVEASSFTGNTANGLGGGGLYMSECSVDLQANVFTRNTAPGGGGGAVLWDGGIALRVLSCDRGWFIAGEYCAPCAPGSWKDNVEAARCTVCGVGKYSKEEGATEEETCVVCPAGKYQNATGSSDCKPCPAHSARRPGAPHACATRVRVAPPALTFRTGCWILHISDPMRQFSRASFLLKTNSVRMEDTVHLGPCPKKDPLICTQMQMGLIPAWPAARVASPRRPEESALSAPPAPMRQPRGRSTVHPAPSASTRTPRGHQIARHAPHTPTRWPGAPRACATRATMAMASPNVKLV